MMKPTNKLKRQLLWLAPVLILGTFLLVLSFLEDRSEKRLLQSKYRLPNPKAVTYTYQWFAAQHSLTPGEWMSDGNMLVCSAERLGKTGVARQLQAYAPKDGSVTKLTDFEAPPAYFIYGRPAAILSFDGKYALTKSDKDYVVVPMNGSKVRLYPFIDPNPQRMFILGNAIAWMPDTDAFVELKETKAHVARIVVHSLGGEADVILEMGKQPGYIQLIGVTPDRTVFIRRQIPNDDFLLIHLDGRVVPTETRKITPAFVDSTSIREIAISPKGDRLLWLTDDFVGSTVLTTLMSDLARRDQPKRTSLWVTDMKGENLHPLGHQTLGITQTYDINNIQWAKDGKSVSFVNTPDLIAPNLTRLSPSPELYFLPAE